MPCTFVPTAARGEDEHEAHEDSGFAPAAQQGEAVDYGQSQVEHHRVVLFRVSEEVSALAVFGAVSGVPGFGDSLGHLPGQQAFVLYNQKAQCNIYSVVG